MKIAKVALFSRIRKIFDYSIPDQSLYIATVGTRVIIPFGNKKLVGFIVAITDDTEVATSKLKSILETIDAEPVFSQAMYNTLLWAVNYYQSSMGEILDCALPKYYKENKSPKNNKLDSKLGVIPRSISNISLNIAQKNIVDKILTHINHFNVSLLEGVTGSGKTEVYLQITKEMLKQNKQTLILVPEIGLTPQTLQRFIERFSDTKVAVLHSNMTDKQRYLNWLDAKNGSAKIILGTRSAAFVPLLNPGLIIIDEEHDLSFKQQDYLKYMARDFLIMRAKFENCPILLGSATPSLETLHNATSNKYLHYKLPTRAISELPKIEIIDIRHKKLSVGLSSMVIEEIKKYLTNKYQVLLFINRRGFSPVLKCFNCQFVQKCKNCDVNMIVHIYTEKLHCHHCQEIKPIPTLCPNCNHGNLVALGQGTERIEKLFQGLFPDSNIVRIDKDAISTKQSFDKILNDILEQKINLLIGTQMIAKGHHFPNLGLVVIVDLDNALFSSDFRATERFGQLIIQVAGRAGREKIGKVLLQTSYPNNALIKAITNYDYYSFSTILFKERQMSGLPPFSHQILWRAESSTIAACLEFLTAIKKLAIDHFLKRNNICKIFGPIPAIMQKRKKKFHARLLFQHDNRTELQNLTKSIVTFLSTNKILSSVNWSIDVDPKEVF